MDSRLQSQYREIGECAVWCRAVRWVGGRRGTGYLVGLFGGGVGSSFLFPLGFFFSAYGAPRRHAHPGRDQKNQDGRHESFTDRDQSNENEKMS